MAARGQKARRDVLRLRRSLARAELVLAELDRLLLAPEHLCASDLGILERLARKGDRPVNGLGKRIGLTSGSMTVAVQRLVRRGLVETRCDPKDKRVVVVSITSQGKEMASRLSNRRAELMDELFSVWSNRERSVLANLLKRLKRKPGADATGGDK